eukprot:m.688278 g.688278  ORF g.688278 m.688278 type:complete len:330 (-) comp58632_c0_seq11:105-1094(-)
MLLLARAGLCVHSCVQDQTPSTISLSQAMILSTSNLMMPDSGRLTQVAVKRMHETSSAADQQAFLHELEMTQAIGQHQSIVSLIGVVLRAQPWLAILELCEYGDLARVLRACAARGTTVSFEERVSFCRQLAQAGQYLAERRIVHMDIAARNCLLAAGNRLKLGDFGLANFYDPDCLYYSQQQPLRLSVRWLAIESADSSQFSEQSDVWAFAVTAWEIFSDAQLPYHRISCKDVVNFVRRGMRLDRPETCSPTLWNLFSRCWDRALARPTFTQIVAQLADVAEPSLPHIDLGSRVNKLLTTQIKRLSVLASVSLDAEAHFQTTPAALDE